MSKPKPASQSEASAASRSEKSMATVSGARSGAAVPTCGAGNLAVDAEEGCLEKPRAEAMPLQRRAPACARARRRSCRSESMSTTGSAKRRSAESLGAGRRGDSTSSR